MRVVARVGEEEREREREGGREALVTSSAHLSPITDGTLSARRILNCIVATPCFHENVRVARTSPALKARKTVLTFVASGTGPTMAACWLADGWR